LLENREEFLKKGIFVEKLGREWFLFSLFTLFFLIFLFSLKSKGDIEVFASLLFPLGCFLVVYLLIILFSVVFLKLKKVHYSNLILLFFISLFLLGGLVKIHV